MSEWKEYKLNAITTKIGSGATPLGGENAYKNSGISLIRSQNVLDFNFSYNGLAFIDEQQAKELDNVTIQKDDILLNITGDSVARVCKVPEKILPARVNQHVSIVRSNTDLVDSNYLLYYLLNPKFKYLLLKIAFDGATRKALTKGNLENLPIKLPPIEEQKRIAAVLSCLDAKIDNLRRQNETLEKIAQTLFKHWFIDFEFPNEEGKPYKSSGGAMSPSELGDIPAGWKVGKLGDVVKKANTGADAIQKAPIVDKDTGIKCLRIGDLSNNKPYYDWGFCEISDSNYQQFKLCKNDILITRTSILGLNKFIVDDINAVYNNGLIRIKIKEDYYPPYIYGFLRSKRYFDYISMINNETSTRPNMKINYLLDFPILISSNSPVNQFSKIQLDFLQKIENNNQQIQTLTKTRDALLPKLMSGEIRIKE